MCPNDSRVLVAGCWTLIGAALVRALHRNGFKNVIAPTAEQYPPTDATAVENLFRELRPSHVFVASGRSGGIEANRRYPAELMLDNLLSTTAIVKAALAYRPVKLLYLASSCCYPAACSQPMRVEDLGTGPLEPTSAAYATAKLAGIHLCQAIRQQFGAPFITGIPADVFGPCSTFDPESSHVIPSLVARMHDAAVQNQKEIHLWGSGKPRREFLFVDDLADACILVMKEYDLAAPINLGGGTELSIAEAASVIADVVGFRGEICCDTSRPDGVARKLLDSAVLSQLGWTATTSFRDAIQRTYASFLDQSLHQSTGGRTLAS